MVFSSIPAYLDPSTWQQQQQEQNHPSLHHGSSSISINPNPLLPPPLLPPPTQPRAQPPPHTGSMSVSSSIRPGSMAERARLANIQMPEPGLKCPRCESTNTKFCYFNNYNLSQPRHFCKGCRRYWTRGGALRNVPVGGGCRRNKRSKSSSSASSSKSASGNRSSSAAATSSTRSGLSGGTHSSVAEMMGLTPPSPLSSLSFMSPLQHLTDFGGGELGLSNYSGISTTGNLGFQLGSIGSGGGGSSGVEQWRIPPPLPPPTQFPLLGELDVPGAASSLYVHPFEGVEFSSLAIGETTGQARSKGLQAGGGSRRMPEPVKLEGSGQDTSPARRFNLGMNQRNGGEQYNWGGGSS